MPKRRKNEQIAAEAEPAEIEATPEDELRAGLEEIKQYEGVIGYILRNTKTAAVDLKDPTKISDYAILSSSALETSEELSELLDLGNVKNIVVEGKDAKVLSLTSGENKISVFMEKDIEHSKALAKLQSL
jgi:predicted regulator of Ras-like GTPase activity (Roadblock/LC7/MglB family)